MPNMEIIVKKVVDLVGFLTPVRKRRAASETETFTPQLRQKIGTHLPENIVEEQCIRVESRQSNPHLGDEDGEPMSPLTIDECSDTDLSQGHEAFEEDVAFLATPVTHRRKTARSLHNNFSNISVEKEPSLHKELECVSDLHYHEIMRPIGEEIFDIYTEFPNMTPALQGNANVHALADEFSAMIASSITNTGTTSRVSEILEEAKKNKLDVEEDAIYSAIVDHNTGNIYCDDIPNDIKYCGVIANKPLVGNRDVEFEDQPTALVDHIMDAFKANDLVELESFLNRGLLFEKFNKMEGKNKTVKRIQELKNEAHTHSIAQMFLCSDTEEIFNSAKFDSPNIGKTPPQQHDDEKFLTPEAISNSPWPKHYLRLTLVQEQDLDKPYQDSEHYEHCFSSLNESDLKSLFGESTDPVDQCNSHGNVEFEN